MATMMLPVRRHLHTDNSRPATRPTVRGTIPSDAASLETPREACSETLMSEHPSPIPHAQIAARAQELWEAEGRPEGKAEDHWHQAESELRRRLAELAAATPPPAIPVVAGIS